MLGRAIGATFLGAVVVYVYLSLSWMALHLHDASIRHLPQEDAFVQMLSDAKLTPGAYTFPGMGEHHHDPAALESFVEKHERGPIGVVFVAPGSPVMAPAVLANGFALDLIGAAILAWLMTLAARGGAGFFTRWSIALAGGVLVATQAHISYWNWMAFPLDHTVAMSLDMIVGWGLAGAVQAALVRPRATT